MATAMILELEGVTVELDEGEFASFPAPVFDDQPVEVMPCGTVAIGGLAYSSNRYIWSPIVQTIRHYKIELIKHICHRAFVLASNGQNPQVILTDLSYLQPYGDGFPVRRLAAGHGVKTIGGREFAYCQFAVYPYNFREESLGMTRVAAFQLRELGILPP